MLRSQRGAVNSVGRGGVRQVIVGPHRAKWSPNGVRSRTSSRSTYLTHGRPACGPAGRPVLVYASKAIFPHPPLARDVCFIHGDLRRHDGLLCGLHMLGRCNRLQGLPIRTSLRSRTSASAPCIAWKPVGLLLRPCCAIRPEPATSLRDASPRRVQMLSPLVPHLEYLLNPFPGGLGERSHHVFF